VTAYQRRERALDQLQAAIEAAHRALDLVFMFALAAMDDTPAPRRRRRKQRVSR
jgi:hypothetical protein